MLASVAALNALAFNSGSTRASIDEFVTTSHRDAHHRRSERKARRSNVVMMDSKLLASVV